MLKNITCFDFVQIIAPFFAQYVGDHEYIHEKMYIFASKGTVEEKHLNLKP